MGDTSRTPWLKGVWTALVTPFNDGLAVDYDVLARLLDRQVEAGVAGVVPCGTTGETPTLTLDERKAVIEFTLRRLRGTGVKVMAGTGGNDTASTIAFSKWARQAGADALLVVVPYYNKPTQNGLHNHFTKVASAVDCPVMLYNVPGRTGARLELDTILRLAAIKNVLAIKEASGDVGLVTDLVTQLQEDGQDLAVLSGDDPIFLPSLAAGAVGVVSVASNVIPAQMVKMQKLADANDLAGAREIHKKYFQFFKGLFVESNPVPVKFALHRMGLCGPVVREPLIEMTLQHKDELSDILKACGLIGAQS
ncbi:MAG TPA: 4-hydroxy-tetrahydrodipicolinate synthase [Bdellovibrionota bacterium]|jgi:4-hydroxy-tetrahydrodipicolinate synthase|nr:4-hydroxy-tetrahydrodipicolinate synthase [Bdellovibrionota bacterium]